MVAAVTLVQVEFRARNDDVTLNSATFTHALNANFSQAVDTNFRVRFTIAETTGGMANNIAFSLQYNLAGAGFVAIGDTAAVKSAISAQFANADPTTQVISTGTFVAGAGYEQTTTSNISLISSRTEIEWCLSIDSTQVTNGQTLTLRVVQDTGTVLQTYTQTPTITVVETAAFAASQAAYQFAEDGTESGATLIGSLNTTLVRNVTADSNLQLRVRLQETGGGSAGAATDDYQLQCSLEGGAFANVTAASTGVKINTASALTDGAATTNRLGAGSGSFVAGEQEESDGLVDNHQLTASNFTEHVWALTLVAADLVEVAFITFRVLRNGSVITYSVTPTVEAAAEEELSFGVVLTDAAVAKADLVESIAVMATVEDATVSAVFGPTPVAAVNTDAELDVDTTYLLRVRVETAVGADGATDFRWSYNHNSAGFLPVTTTSSAIKAVAASSFVNDDDVPEVLGGSGIYLENNNAGSEDGTTTLGAELPAGGAVEFVLAFQIVGADVADAQTGQIRLELGDGTDLDAYTNTLTYTVNVAGAAEVLTFGLDAGAAPEAAAAVDESTTEAAVAAVAVAAVAATDESTTEAAAAGDAVVATADAAEAIAEAAALADASTAVQDLDGVVDAPLVADFVIAEFQDSGASVDAATTFADAATAAASVVAAITEPAALDDAETELAAGTAVLSEPAELADAATAAQALTGSLDAALVADASQSSDSDAAEVVTEAATLADAVAADAAFVGTVTAQLVFDDVEASTAVEFPTPVAAVNTDADLVVSQNYLIVARVENTGIEGATDFRWSHNHEGAGWVHVAPAEEAWSDGEEFSDGTGWLNVGAVIAVPAVTFDNDDDVPEMLGGAGTYLADNNAATEDGTTTLPSNFPASGAVEFVLAFQLRSGAVNNDETGQIRLELGDGTDLDAYDFTFTYTVVGGVTAEVLTFGLLLGKTPTALAAIDETVDLVAALADAGTAAAEVDEALAVAATVADAATAAAALSETLPESAIEAATEQVGLSGPTGELNAPLAVGDALTAIAATSEATTEGVSAQDSASSAAALMEAIVAGSILDDTASGDTAGAIEIVEAVDLAGAQIAVAALEGVVPASASFAADLVARVALSEILVTPSAFADAEAAAAALVSSVLAQADLDDAVAEAVSSIASLIEAAEFEDVNVGTPVGVAAYEQTDFRIYNDDGVGLGPPP